jgi:tetratricopeptide (TPR) repeat protein
MILCAENYERRENEMKQTDHRRLWHIGWNVGLLIVVTLFLHGCAVKHPVDWPTRPAPAPPPRPISTPRPAPIPAPAPAPSLSRESVPVAEEGRAAGTLLASARQNVRAGQFSQAEMVLERALRLEPRNARLWYEMAQVKYGQKDYGQVVQFCIKSNSLAGKDYGLTQQNWLLMEKAYLQLGEPEKARQARIKSG